MIKEIKNDKNQKIVGVLTNNSSSSLVILCHGYTATKDMDGLVHVANSLNQNGFSTFRFDFSGSGESEGSKELSLKQQVADLEAIIDYFKAFKHIYLLGHSLGMLPVLICSRLMRVTGVISINGFFRGKVYRRDFNRAYWTLKILRFFVPRINSEWKFMEQFTKPEKIDKPILIITTKNDEILDYRQSIDFSKHLSGKAEVEVLTLSGHGFNTTADSQIIANSIVKWIKA